MKYVITVDIEVKATTVKQASKKIDTILKNHLCPSGLLGYEVKASRIGELKAI